MRQIGSDLNQDPTQPIVTEAIGQADLNDPANAATYAQFTWNKFQEMSLKYCSRGLNLSRGSFSEAEQSRFQTCLNKYQQAFSIYEQEQSVHDRAMAAIDAAGGDRYAHLNEYDRF